MFSSCNLEKYSGYLKEGLIIASAGKLQKQHFGKILKIIITKNCKILDVFLMQLREVLVISETAVNYRNKHGKNFFFKSSILVKILKIIKAKK